MPFTGPVTAGRIQVSIETSVPTCGEYPGLGPKILVPSAGPAPAVSGTIIPAVAAAIEVKNVLRLAVGKFFIKKPRSTNSIQSGLIA